MQEVSSKAGGKMKIILVILIMYSHTFGPGIKTIEYKTIEDCFWRETRINELAKTVKEKKSGQIQSWEANAYVVRAKCITVKGEE